MYPGAPSEVGWEPPNVPALWQPVSNGLATARFWSFDRDTPTGNGASTMNGNGDPPLAYNNEYVKDLGVQ